MQTFIISDPKYQLHRTNGYHPEKPSRVLAIENSLKENGLLTSHNLLTPKLATTEDLLLAHSHAYIDLVEKECQAVQELAHLSTGDVEICKDSYEIARLAAGGVLTAVDKVYHDDATSAFCNIRPPGHHACPEIGMGFCLFNNVVIGARYAMKKYGIKKVLIVDWDVHHGNGTQAMVWNDPSIFYFSTHQWPLYPGTGAHHEKGAKGNILNCPISAGKLSRLEVLKAFQEELPKAMEVFHPEAIFISAGFDAHELDPLGGMNLTKEDFGELTQIMKGLANRYSQRKLISVLEGGYNLQALAESTVEHVKMLNVR